MNYIKLPKNNDSYLKTFGYKDLTKNNISIASFEHLVKEYIVDFIENLIYDLIHKRKLVSKNIVIITDSIGFKEALLGKLLDRGVFKNEAQVDFSSDISGGRIYHWLDENMKFNENFAPEKTNIDLSNVLTITDKTALRKVNNSAELFELKDLDNHNPIDTFILMDFEKIRDYDELALENLRKIYTNTKWVGINTEIEKERPMYIQLNEEIMDIVPEIPETFNGFVNNSVQENIIKVLRALGNNKDALAFEEMYKRGVFENDNIECQIEIGTNEFIENEEDSEAEDIGNINEFYISLKINRNSLELECQLQDFDWSGTGFANYLMDFEFEIVEKKDIKELDDIVDVICHYISERQLTVNTKYTETNNN